MDMAMFETALAEADLPGAACMIVDSSGERFSHATGFADATSKAPMALNTPCQIASMTKALVSVGAMQLVEQGLLELDAPIGQLLPQMADPQVLTGFDDAGAPLTRPAKTQVTLRHLLTHTSGLGYFFIHPEILNYFSHVGMPAPGAKAGVEMPLMFDPGESWEYSVATDWVGFAIEAASGQQLRDYMRAQIFEPLAMGSTAFHDAPPEGLASVHVRDSSGGFTLSPMFISNAEFDSGGGGIVSTVPDYARFLRAMLRGGELDGQHILQPETVKEMGRNQIGQLRAGYMGSALPEFSPPFNYFPDQHTGWGLGFLINPEAGPDGRSPGSLSWAGIFNSYYWIDPSADVAGVFITQMSPFGDPGALAAFGALERLAYS